MATNAMPREAIDAVIAAGFEVYMNKPDASWLYYTDGTRIGCLENDRLIGLRTSTVHIPNRTTGTGYSMNEPGSPERLTREVLERAFGAPAWASMRDHAATKKWANWEAFAKANTFLGAYTRVI